MSNKLTKIEMACINAFISGAYRYRRDAVIAFFPEITYPDQKASSLFNGEKGRKYIEEAQKDCRIDRETAIESQRFKWRAQAEGIDSILVESGIAESIFIPDTREEVFESATALIDGMPIPSSAKAFIERLEIRTDENGRKRKCVVVKKVSEKDRLKASELLIRSYGGFTDKQEITGADGDPLVTQSITTEMTAQQAAEIYQRSIKKQGK